jgi:pimeloyl-ACP methyl ester carboxylesterase
MEDPKKRKDDPPKGSKRFDTTRCAQKGYPMEVKGILRAWLLVALIAVLVGVSVSPNNATAQATYSEEVGTIPRGTPYRIRVPTKWNGTLINDLDFANGADADRYLYLLDRGYAVSGTARRSDRSTNYDPAHEIHDLVTVLDIFEAQFGKPSRTLQYGHSGGGHVTLGMAEIHPDRIDGAIAGCAHTPVWLMNSELDAWFALKALLAPDLPIVDLPADLSAITRAWRQVINAAQQTPVGRARIALATTLGQLPAWVSATTPEPDPNDVSALQQSMYESLIAGAAQPAGQSRFMFEHSAPGQLSGNTEVDYKKFFQNGDEFYKRAVRRLYRDAGVDLEADLERINVFPRVTADVNAIKWWSAPGRTVSGEPKVPVLRIHTNGDPSVPVSLVQGYDAEIRANRYTELYRTAFINRPGHCTFSVAEIAAAIETVMQRLDTGRWGSTDPIELNSLGNSLDPTSTSRYFDFKQIKYNRRWFPTVEDFLGQH